MVENTNTPYKYEDRYFEVGSWYRVVGEAPYTGLQCILREIRDGDDIETDNPGPDLICDCLLPNTEKELAALEAGVSAAYGTQVKADNINLDYIILAPDMLKPLDGPPACFMPESDNHYPLCIRRNDGRCKQCLWRAEDISDDRGELST